MPIFEVTDPSTGRTFDIEGDSPPNETELNEIFGSMSGPQQTTTREPVPEQPDPSLSGSLRVPFTDLQLPVPAPVEAGMVAVGRGLNTVARGVGLDDQEDPATKAAFQQLRTDRPISTAIGSVVGESIPFLPLGAVGKIPAVANKAKTAAGAIGALEGGVIAAGQGGDAFETGKGAAIGGSVAATVEAALPAMLRNGGRLLRRAFGIQNPGALIDNAGNPVPELQKALQDEGIAFDELAPETKTVFKENVDPSQAVRKAVLESEGLTPTRAQITRIADDFVEQQQAAKISGNVRDALEEQEAILTTRFDNAVLGTGGESVSAENPVVAAITERAENRKAKITALYNEATEVSQGQPVVTAQRLVNTLKSLRGSETETGGLISAIRGDLVNKEVINKKGEIISPITVEMSDKIRKVISAKQSPTNNDRNVAIRKLKDSLDDDVMLTVGQDTFAKARKAKRDFEKGLERAKVSSFDELKTNLVRDILTNKASPETLTEAAVFGKKYRPEHLQQLKLYLNQDDAGKQAFNDLRADAMSMIKDKSFFGPVDGDGFQALSRGKLEKAIKSIGIKRMNILFTAPERKFINNMLAVAKLREPVRGTALGLGPSGLGTAQVAKEVVKLNNLIPTSNLFGELVNKISLDKKGRAVLKATPKSRIEKESLSGAIAPAVSATAPTKEN